MSRNPIGYNKLQHHIYSVSSFILMLYDTGFKDHMWIFCTLRMEMKMITVFAPNINVFATNRNSISSKSNCIFPKYDSMCPKYDCIFQKILLYLHKLWLYFRQKNVFPWFLLVFSCLSFFLFFSSWLSLFFLFVFSLDLSWNVVVLTLQNCLGRFL